MVVWDRRDSEEWVAASVDVVVLVREIIELNNFMQLSEQKS